MSASVATTCLRSAIGAGACEFDLSIRCEMTDVEPGLPVLALNSGSSSLKVGLYRVGSTCVEVLLTGEAESIGDKEGKFVARNSRNEVLVSEAAFVPGQREAIVRIARLLTDVKMPARSLWDIGSCMADQSSGVIASLTTRSRMMRECAL